MFQLQTWSDIGGCIHSAYRATHATFSPHYHRQTQVRTTEIKQEKKNKIKEDANNTEKEKTMTSRTAAHAERQQKSCTHFWI